MLSSQWDLRGNCNRQFKPPSIVFSESKGIMEKAGVPCIPGYYGNNQDPTFLAQKAQEIGYPIMIKAVLGGGGKVCGIFQTRWLIDHFTI